MFPYFWKPNFLYSVQNSSPIFLILTQNYPPQTVHYFVYKMLFHIIFQFMPRSSVFPTKNVCLRATCPFHLLVTSSQSNGTANPQDHNIQCAFDLL